MRSFEVHVEQAATQWRACVETAENWRLRPDLGQFSTALRPFWVSSKTIVGIAKPGHSNIPVTKFPLAAHEKIAADLAFDLGLPVPPVILWDRGNLPPGEERFTNISAVPFANTREWGKARQDAALADEIREKMRTVASAMCAFDTWVQNTDHNDHPGNLLVSLGPDPERTLRVAYIDYAYSLGYAWGNGEWANSTCIPIYDPKIVVDLPALKAAIEKIGMMPQDTVCSVVERISERFLPVPHGAAMKDGLLDRQSRLWQIVGTRYAGLS